MGNSRPRGRAATAVVGLLLALISTLVAGAPHAAATVAASVVDPRGDDNIQVDAAHDGHSTQAFGPDLRQAWGVNLGEPARQVLIDSGRVFVVLDDALVALDATSGGELWRQPAGDTLIGATVSGATVIDVDFSGLVRAYAADSGRMIWSRALQQGRTYVPPTSSDGVLYVSDAQDGGNLYAIDVATSDILWTGGPELIGDGNAPTVADGLVIVDDQCDDADALHLDGSAAWRHPGCGTPQGGLSPIYGGRVWLRDPVADSTAVVDEKTGAEVATTTDENLPAFDGSLRFVAGSAVSATTLDDPNTPVWTSAADDYTDAAPLTLGGQVAVIGAYDRVDLLDEKTGALAWTSGTLPTGTDDPVPGSIDPTPSYLLAAGDGLLAAPVGSFVYAFQSDSAPGPAEPTPAAAAATPVEPPEVGLLTDEWSSAGGDPAHTSDSGDDFSATLTERWSFSGGSVQGQPLILPGVVVAAFYDSNDVNDDDVYGLSTVTGLPLWGPVQVPDGGDYITLTATDGVVIVAGEDTGIVTAIQSLTGTVLWGSEENGSGAPQADGAGHFWHRGGEFDATTGEQIGGGRTVGNQPVAEAVSGGTRFGLDGDAYRVDDGTTTWTGGCTTDYVDREGNLPFVGELSPGPVDGGGWLAVKPYRDGTSQVGIVDPTTGACVRTEESARGVAVDGADAVLVQSDDVIAEEPLTGTVLWRASLPGRPIATPVVGPDEILVATRDPQELDSELVVLDRATGAVLGSTPVDGTVSAYVAAAQGIALVSTSAGVVAYSDGTSLLSVLPTSVALPLPTASSTVSPTATPSGGVPTPSRAPVTVGTPVAAAPSSPAPAVTPAVGSALGSALGPARTVRSLRVTASPAGLVAQWKAPAGVTGMQTYVVSCGSAQLVTTSTRAVLTTARGQSLTLSVTDVTAGQAPGTATAAGRAGVPWSPRQLKLVRSAGRATVTLELPQGMRASVLELAALRGRAWRAVGRLHRVGSRWAVTVRTAAPVELVIAADATHTATRLRLHG